MACAIIAALLVMRISKNEIIAWLTARLAAPAAPPPAPPRRAPTALICAAIFMIAVGVRLLHWQDLAAEIARGEPWMADLVRQYKSDAQYMLDGNGILFPRDQADPGDPGLLGPPPG